MQLSTNKILSSILLGIALSADSAQAQVTLVSQNRFVSAYSYYNPPQCSQTQTNSATGFDAFTQTFAVQCLGANIGNAAQTSTLSPTAFNFELSASASGNAPTSGSGGTSHFEVVFDVTGGVPYTSTVYNVDGNVRIVGPGIDRNLASSETGTLSPGRYTLSSEMRAVGPGTFIPGGYLQSSITFGQPLPSYTIDLYTIDGGGAMNEIGGSMSLSGGIGQFDAGPILSGGTLTLAGGFWTMSTIPSGPICDSIDFNNDFSFFDPQDIDAFLSVYAEGPCLPETNTCNDIDFNNDGSLFDPCDIDSFLLVFSEGPCALCGV